MNQNILKQNIFTNKLLTRLSIGNIFGMISGVITGLGLIYGLYGANISKKPIIIGLLSIAISDSISDALGIYYGTNENKNEAFLALFSKFIIPVIMAMNFYLFNKKNAVIINTIFSFIILTYVNFKMENNTFNIEILYNLILTSIIIFIVYYAGIYINKLNL
jgi:hypothetical protein